MKLAVISDVHLGDPNCTMVAPDAATGPKFEEFAEAAGTGNDYLILLGDIFDFSIASYADVYRVARAFFRLIQERGIAEELLYVPGNHDFEFWHLLEHEVNIIKPIHEGQEPRGFRWAVPGVLDDRQSDPRHKFSLPDVESATDPAQPRYGRIFLSDLVRPRLNVNVAYPNLYLVTGEGEVVLLTHGHYFETYWSVLGELAMNVLGDDLRVSDPEGRELTIEEVASINFPLNQLASSGVGQAGPLTDVVRAVQRDIKDGVYGRVERYLEKLDEKFLDRLFHFPPWSPSEWATDAVIHSWRKWFLERLRASRHARYDRQFMQRDDVRRRFERYCRACVKEIDRLRDLPDGRGLDLPPRIRRVIFGHTHQPMGWDDPHIRLGDGSELMDLYNTGGWLVRGDGEFRGAAVFRYESGRGLWSEAVE